MPFRTPTKPLSESRVQPDDVLETGTSQLKSVRGAEPPPDQTALERGCHMLSLDELMRHFESIGNNCEFGIVQRATGYDPPGLFRNVGFLKSEQIINAIGAGLVGMFDENNYTIGKVGWPDYAIDCKVFGFRFHTGIAETDPIENVAKIISLFRVLKRKFLEDLAEGHKTFVYRHNESKETTPDIAEQLLLALRKHGPNWLLFVREDSDPDHRFAYTQLSYEGLISGGIPKLSQENPPVINFAAWEKLLRSAMALRGEPITNELAMNQPGQGAAAHVYGDGAKPLFEIACAGLEPGSEITAETEIFVPSNFDGPPPNLLVWGYATTKVVLADQTKRDCWQPISVSAAVPISANRAVLAFADAQKMTTPFYSRNWKISRDHKYRSYKIVHDMVAPRTPYPNIDFPLAPIRFGQVSAPDFAVVEYPDGGWDRSARIARQDVAGIELSDAVIHGEEGILTVGDEVLFASMRLAKFEWDGSDRIKLVEKAPDMRVSAASYAMCGHVGTRNYAHWLVDIMPAISPPFVSPGSVIVLPKLRTNWQRDYLKLISTPPLIEVEPSGSIVCDRLHLSPISLLDSGHEPHPLRMAQIAEIKSKIPFDTNAKRKLYISRRDSTIRTLINEDVLIESLAKQGFEILTLSGMSVQDQIKAFSEAVCVVGAHGAGLANVIFCAPGTVLCELIMDNYVQWSMRILSSLVPLHYGCVVGREIGG
ncbi:unnamed protein product [Sphagnum tenellum]